MSVQGIHERHIDAVLTWVYHQPRLHTLGDIKKYTQNEFGQMVMWHNTDAYNSTYDANHDDPVYEFKEYSRKLSTVELIKAVKFIEYNCRESQHWSTSQLKVFLTVILNKAILELPGYAQAAWCIEE